MNNLKQWREKHCITQQQVGEILGISRSQVANIESGKNRLSIEFAKKLSSTALEIIDLCQDDIYKESPNELKKLGYELKVIKRRNNNG